MNECSQSQSRGVSENELEEMMEKQSTEPGSAPSIGALVGEQLIGGPTHQTVQVPLRLTR